MQLDDRTGDEMQVSSRDISAFRIEVGNDTMPSVASARANSLTSAFHDDGVFQTSWPGPTRIEKGALVSSHRPRDSQLCEFCRSPDLNILAKLFD